MCTAYPVSIYDERRIAMALADAESLPVQGAAGRFMPEGIILLYGKPSNQSWQLIRVEVYGPKLKTGGVLSSVRGSHCWYPPDDKPGWLQSIIDIYLPGTGE
jgi:hypothetical protein